MGDVLVFAEHVKGKLPKTTLAAIEAGRQAASRIGGACHAVVLGKGVDALGTETASYGVKKVFVVDGDALEHYVADAYTEVLADVMKQKTIDLLVATSTAIGKDLLPRVAARLGAGMAIGRRPLQRGRNADAADVCGQRHRYREARRLAARGIGTGHCVRRREEGRRRRGREARPSASTRPRAKAKFVAFNETKSDRPVLTEASIVVSGGRGLKNGENFTTYLEPLVDVLGAAMGASRARGGRGLRAERPAGRPDRQGRRAARSTSRSASRARSSTSPA